MRYLKTTKFNAPKVLMTTKSAQYKNSKVSDTPKEDSLLNVLEKAAENRLLAVFLRITWYRLDRVFTKQIQHIKGLTSDRYTILRWISDLHPDHVNQTDLVNLTGFHPNTISQVLPSLEKNNWIVRQRCPKDKRIKIIKITEEGIKIVNKVSPIGQKIQTNLLKSMSPTEVRTFIDQLKTIAVGCTELLKNDDALEPNYESTTNRR